MIEGLGTVAGLRELRRDFFDLFGGECAGAFEGSQTFFRVLQRLAELHRVCRGIAAKDSRHVEGRLSCAIECAPSSASGFGQLLEGGQLCLRRHDEVAIHAGREFGGIGDFDESVGHLVGLITKEPHGLDDILDAIFRLQSLFTDADELVGHTTDGRRSARSRDAHCTHAFGDS